MTDEQMTLLLLKHHFAYNRETGEFTRKTSGKVNGKLATNGYVQVIIGRKYYMAHRLAWLHEYGKWPESQIDHINRIRTDNRIANLRLATNKQNCENVGPLRKNNTSGRTGIHWRDQDKTWEAWIKNNRKSRFLGSYKCKIDAVAARIRAEKQLFTHAPIYAQISHGSGKLLISQGGSTPARGIFETTFDSAN